MIQRALLVAATLMLAAAAAPATPEATVASIYAPYRSAAGPRPVWERPIWSAEVRGLIARWRRVVPRDDVDELNDGDWLCQCQDWDNRGFTVSVRSSEALSSRLARMAVTLDLGVGETRDAILTLVNENGRWKVDDVRAEDFPRGLKRALRETIKKESRQ